MNQRAFKMEKLPKNKSEWKKKLSPQQYKVMFEHGTEQPFSGKYYLSREDGVYKCAACGNPLFSSDSKFHTECGWPSFAEPLSEHSVEYKDDLSHAMRRIEVTCWRCGAHLGHVFPDGPAPMGQRYCINSISLELEKK